MTVRSVRRLPADPGPAAWNMLLPPPPAAEMLEDVRTADWLIIGGGFAGLAAARRLSQLHPTDHIALLEARRIADGPAGRNSGFMIDLPHDLSSKNYGGSLDQDLFQTRANRAGIAFASEMAEEFGLDEEAFSQCGKINAAATAKGHQHNLDFAAHLSRMAEDHRLLDAVDMQKMTGTSYYQSGLFTPGAAQIQPAKFVRSIAKSIVSNRVRVYENSPVLALRRRAGWVAETPKGRISAPRVILAVNGHMNSFGFLPGRLLHVFTFASMTRELSSNEVGRLGGEDHWGVMPADPMGTTVRRISGSGGARIVVRNRFVCAQDLKINPKTTASAASQHDKAFLDRFPMLTGVEMEYRWGGALCLSKNAVPAFGELEAGLYSACCQNGLGTARGTLSGKLAAELASGHQSSLLDEMLEQPDPVRLPPAPIAQFGANAVIRYQESRAGAEL